MNTFETDKPLPRRRGLLLHLHPQQVPAASLRLTYTFGLGGLALLLLVILTASGTLLMFAYTPSSDEAYRSIVALETEVWFGQLIRNLHHWSGNLLLVVACLHMLRVFYTAAFQTPREFNWQLGLALLGLVILANFTGYLLPWDQLSYWAVTVTGNLIDHIPLIGGSIRRILLGGDTVSGVTLANFFTLHVLLVPLGFLTVGAFHIWRVRKDKFSVPRVAGRPVEYVPASPHLVSRELVFGLVATALLLTWATWVDAPLKAAANPNTPPNPTKTVWYFMGIQELMLHFHPTFGAVIIPGLALGALIALPYLRTGEDSTGIWFRSMRGRWLAAISFLLGVAITLGLVILDGYRLAASRFLPVGISQGLLPLGIIGLILFGYYKLLRGFKATLAETHMALFTFALAAFVTLTLIGILLRGENMGLELPR